MDPTPAPSPFGYRTAGLASRNQRDLAVEIIEADTHDALLPAAPSPARRAPSRGVGVRKGPKRPCSSRLRCSRAICARWASAVSEPVAGLGLRPEDPNVALLR